MPEWQILEEEARSIVEGAAPQATLRVMGSAGMRLHCQPLADLLDEIKRPAKDIDFVVPKRDRKAMRSFLEGRGYVVDRDLLVAMEGRRYTFTNAARDLCIDVFVENLEFCHTIPLGGRLSRTNLTLPLEELLLQKLQIVNITETDLQDIAALLATHHVGGSDAEESIDGEYIAKLLANDWGFHHTATSNLERFSGRWQTRTGGLGETRDARIAAEASALHDAIDSARKSVKWRARARVGERVQWWEDVNDKEATY